MEASVTWREKTLRDKRRAQFKTSSFDTRNNFTSTMGHHPAADLSYSIVWSPLPPITWIFPVIGHMGIADSNGVASDFRGPYFVGDDGRLAFGPATRVLKIEPLPERDRWDEAIQEANAVYRGRMHNLFCDNCHSHVACALNRMPITAFGISKWDMVKLALLMFWKGRFLSWWGVYAQFGPFVVLLLLLILSSTLTKR